MLALPSQLAQPAAQLGTHAPDVHAVVPCALVHAIPQPLQLLVVPSWVSQPLDAVESQLPQPLVQELIWQVPLEHTGVALARVQALLQAPQWLTFVPSVTSQPFETRVSQLP